MCLRDFEVGLNGVLADTVANSSLVVLCLDVEGNSGRAIRVDVAIQV